MRRSILFPAFLFLAVAVLAGKPASAAPITIVDTGPGSGDARGILGGAPFAPQLNQWLAAEFTVSDNWLITGVQGWIDPAVTGNVRFSLYSDGGDTPGSTLFEQLLSIAGTGATGWYGPSGLNWLIGPGSYWLAFETPDTFWGVMPSPSPNPLANEAYRNGQMVAYSGDDRIDHAVRVFAEPVPDESSSVVLFASVLLAAGIHSLWRRRRLAVT